MLDNVVLVAWDERKLLRCRPLEVKLLDPRGLLNVEHVVLNDLMLMAWHQCDFVMTFWLMLLACKYTVFAFLFTCHAGGYMKEPEEVRATPPRGGQMGEGINVAELLEDTIARLEVARNLLQAHEPGQNS